MDWERFFLEYIDQSVISEFDFNNPDSVTQFRDLDYRFKGMGGCNLRKEFLEKSIRGSGIKLSDPEKRIIGQFDIRNHTITYSPIFPFFFEERDLIKFARDTYFTTLTFEELIKNQINHAISFYVHTGDYTTTKDIINYGTHIFEEVSKEEMLALATQEELGNDIRKRYLKRYQIK